MTKLCAPIGAVLLLLCACGKLVESDTGSESHWLRKCSADADCDDGSCMCGMCTVTCDAVTECPHPLDVCRSAGLDPMGGRCSTDAPDQGLCGIQDAQQLETVSALDETIVLSCDMGRTALMSVSLDRWGQRRAALAQDGSIFLFASWNLGDSRIVRVNTEGELLQELRAPSDLSPTIDDLLPLPSGHVVLSGTVRSFEGHRAWVGEVDAGWQLVWERQLESENQIREVYLDALPNGEVVLAAVGMVLEQPDGGAPVPESLHMERFDDAGEVLWERSITLDGYQDPGWNVRVLAVTSSGEPKAVVGTDAGLAVVSVDAQGELQSQLLETTLALGLAGVTALPDDRLAIASNRAPGAILTVVDRDADVVLERSYGRDDLARVGGVTYDAARDQIVLAGEARLGKDGDGPGSWMIATDLQGQQAWTMTRLPMKLMGVDGEVAEVSSDRGPDLQSVIATPDGVLIATGGTSEDISFFVVGAGACP